MNIIDEVVKTHAPKEAERLLTDALGQRVLIGYLYDPEYGEYLEVTDEHGELIREVLI